MTDKQRELIVKMAVTIGEIADECENDDEFHAFIIDNNDLFPMSLDEWSAEWHAIAWRSLYLSEEV